MFETHEDLEHLAIMERYIGKITVNCSSLSFAGAPQISLMQRVPKFYAKNSRSCHLAIDWESDSGKKARKARVPATFRYYFLRLRADVKHVGDFQSF